MEQIYYYYCNHTPQAYLMIVPEPYGYAVLLLITIIQKWNKYNNNGSNGLPNLDLHVE